MITHICDRCCRPIEEGWQRYIAKIQVYAAPDPIVVDEAELKRDQKAEIAAAMAKCEGMTEEELMRDVYVEFQFDLCRSCQRAYIANPLPMAEVGGTT